jgi:hypothetical protein
MSGEAISGTTGTVTYSETIYDEAHGNAMRMHSEAVCHRSDQPPSNPPVVAQAPAPAPASPQVGDSMPIAVIGTHAAAPVVLGSMPVTMMIDTGCTDLSITQTIAERIASGQATYAASRTYVLADGSPLLARIRPVGADSYVRRPARPPSWGRLTEPHSRPSRGLGHHLPARLSSAVLEARRGPAAWAKRGCAGRSSRP